MATPLSITTLDLSGKWVMNKTLSDDTDEILRLQGIGWLIRKAVTAATVTLHIRHYKDDNDVEHIDIEQKIAAGLPGTNENRTLDWTFRETSDYIFGPVLGKSRRVRLEELDNEFLRNGWSPDTVEHGAIDAYVKSDTQKSKRAWIAEQVWGFEEIDGERRHVRHVHFTGPKDEYIQARLVFDFYAPAS